MAISSDTPNLSPIYFLNTGFVRLILRKRCDSAVSAAVASMLMREFVSAARFGWTQIVQHIY